MERKLAAHLFNETWRLMEMPGRTTWEDAAMIHCAHASRYHWDAVGDASNKAIGEWQISRVYSMLAFGDQALYHARLCLELCETHSLRPFLKGYAHEAMARALTLNHDAAARPHYQAACEFAAATQDLEDRRLLETDLNAIVLD
jgi:hypothetical protein